MKTIKLSTEDTKVLLDTLLAHSNSLTIEKAKAMGRSQKEVIEQTQQRIGEVYAEIQEQTK